MLIAQITDTHVGFEPKAGEDEFNVARLRSVLAHLCSQPMQPDMLILTGDLTDGGQPECYARIKRLVAQCPFPVHVIPGNHDNRVEMLKAFSDCPTHDGFIQFVIESGEASDPLRVLCLDTFEPGRHGGAFCTSRAAWLAEQLSNHPDTPTIIFMHHPPLAAGIDWMDPCKNEPWLKRFCETVRGHKQIISIQAGHLHRPVQAMVEGIPICVSPAVAPAVTLDLRPVDTHAADYRAIVAAEPPSYSLHLWRGGNLVSHFQPVGNWQTLARYEEHLEPMMQNMFSERI